MVRIVSRNRNFLNKNKIKINWYTYTPHNIQSVKSSDKIVHP